MPTDVQTGVGGIVLFAAIVSTLFLFILVAIIAYQCIKTWKARHDAERDTEEGRRLTQE